MDEWGETPTEKRLGDQPIEAEYRGSMNDAAHIIDMLFNGERAGTAEARIGFVLLAFQLEGGQDNRCNYISNARRKDVIAMMKEQLARFEGQAELTGKA